MVLVSKNLFSKADNLLSKLVYTMLDTLIQSKTRLKLLLRFFLNPDSSAYLRGLAQEFDESTNAVRVELNRFEEAGLIQSHKEGNKKMYQVNLFTCEKSCVKFFTYDAKKRSTDFSHPSFKKTLLCRVMECLFLSKTGPKNEYLSDM